MDSESGKPLESKRFTTLADFFDIEELLGTVPLKIEVIIALLLLAAPEFAAALLSTKSFMLVMPAFIRR